MQTIAVVTDLLFGTKITGTGKVLNNPVLVARNTARLSELIAAHATTTPDAPLQVIVDLNATGVDPIEAVRLAKSQPAVTRVIAYLSHVQVELAEQARIAGADSVMARSGFVNQLPALLTP